MKKLSIIILSIAALALVQEVSAKKDKKSFPTPGVHPSLLLTSEGVKEIRAARGTNAEFDKVLDKLFSDADRGIGKGITVPQPVDGGGGYSHEKHKDNYYDMYYCGIAYQLSGDEKYAAFVADMLSEYAKVYPTLGYHPMTLSKTPGRLFWQTLNECVWLIHASIAYDCVYDYVPAHQREVLENSLFRPMCEFIMDGMGDNRENNVTFNKMHNHGTWATAAVGMCGYVIGASGYVSKALYGSDMTGKNGGFMQQLGELFSPDGYFTEGAYYQRYSIWPFMMFAQAINNNDPSTDIFSYRDNILEKALDVLLQLAYEGEFMKINDAVEKGYDAQEVVYAIDVIYNANQSKKELLDIAQRFQKTYLPTDAGYAVARDVAKGEAVPFKYKSVMLRDGADGTQGGVGVIRSTDKSLNSALLMKATSHGLSHGHYDKLMIAYYDNGSEILTDYGASRFHNIEAKYKGHYTPENKTFAMSTIAHNTVAVDQASHFGGDIRVSSKYHSDIYYYDLGGDNVQLLSAKETNAVPGVNMHRTTAYITTSELQYPLILDIFRLSSAEKHSYDLPFYYNGTMISFTGDYDKSLDVMRPLGTANGYQHLWEQAVAKPCIDTTQCFTFMQKDRMYSISTAVGTDTQFSFVMAGANDPNFHLLPATGYIIREKEKANHTFVSTIETHGYYDVKQEQAANLVASVAKIELLLDSDDYTVARVELKNGSALTFCMANNNQDRLASHNVELKSGTFSWNGVYAIK